MKLKFVVAAALVLFILIAGNIIALGLLSEDEPQDNTVDYTKDWVDDIALVTTTTTTIEPIPTTTLVDQVDIPTTTQETTTTTRRTTTTQPDPQPVRRRRSRAS